METKKINLILGSAVALLLTSACDKNERAYKHFMDEGRWVVTELTAGTTSFTKLPKWQITPCEDHTTYCLAKWEHQNGSSANFYWRFTNLGGDFDFYVDPMESDTQTMAFSQCANFSGAYDVIESGRKRFKLQSEKTTGYPDKLVIIQLELP